MTEILVVEDNEGLRNILKEALAEEGHAITTAENAEEGIEKLKTAGFDIVITDLKLPEGDGITVLEAAKSEQPGIDVIVITAYGTVEKAVGAMKKGAADFMTKPFSIDHIRLQVAKILKNRKIKEENAYLKSSAKREIVGASPKIKEIIERVNKIAQNDATILIMGESGTGKEIIAEAIHTKSNRADFPLIKVNCAALAPGVLESELFGHEKGSFTDAVYMKKGRFELANKGTIFLDEIADLPLALQVKLLRVIQEKEFERVGGEKTLKSDVRIIAATNKDLKAQVKAGKFREELYYRLNVVEIYMPSLRERREDIPLLAEYFIKKYSDFSGYRVKGIRKKALSLLETYDYPGNIRELENIIQRMLVLSGKEMLEEEDVPYELKQGNREQGTGNRKRTETLEDRVDGYEKNLILEALKETGGNKMKAAEVLKVNRATLMSKIKKYGID
jgi:two-component system, NtrC family, response regulator AtoC